MTKEERLNQIVALKKEIDNVREDVFNVFENFWPEKNHNNVKELADFMTSLTDTSNRIQSSMLEIVKQCNNDYERAAPYICDILLREWNNTTVRANKHFGVILSGLIEEQKGCYKDKLDEIMALDIKINKLLLSEYVNE